MDVEDKKHVTILDSQAADTFVCAICYGAPTPARMACKNNHLFCEGCLEQACDVKPECPSCRGPLIYNDSKVGWPATYVDKIIDSLMCQCPNGCGAQFKVKELKNHDLVCTHKKLDCPFKDVGCNCQPERRFMQEHIKSFSMEHTRMQSRASADACHDIKNESNRTRNMMKQVYENLGKVNIEALGTICRNQKAIEEKVDRLTIHMGLVLQMLSMSSSFVMDSQTRIASEMAATGRTHSAGELFVSIKRKADDMKSVMEAMKVEDACKSLRTPLSKRRCSSPPPPGAPGPSSLRPPSDLLPRLRDVDGFLLDRGSSSRIQVDELDMRRRASSPPGAPSVGSPVSPSYSPTSPAYEPGGDGNESPAEHDDDDSDEDEDGDEVSD